MHFIDRRIPTSPELRRRCFSEHDPARLPQLCDQQFVLLRNVVAIERRAIRGHQPLGIVQILYTEWKAMQWRQFRAADQGFRRGTRFRSGPIVTFRHNSVYSRVHHFDPRNARLDEFNRGQSFTADQPPRFDRG